MWSLFGGHLEDKETLKQGLIREIKEETGIDLCPNDLVWLGTQSLRYEGNSLHYFEAPLRVGIDVISLKEGSGFALCGLEELRALNLTPESARAIDRFFERAGFGWLDNDSS